MPPLVIAGGVAAAGAIGGAVIGANAQKKAASQANQAQQQATDAQLQLGRESLDLNKQIYNSNYDILSPYVSRGNQAGGAINALLGLGNAPVMHSPLATPTAGTPRAPAGTPATSAPGGYGQSLGQIGSQNQMDAYMGYYRAHPEQDPGFTSISQFHGDPYRDEASASAVLAGHQNYLASHPTPAPTATPAPAAHTPAAQNPAQTANQAMQNFANSAGMQFQLKQGADMLNNRYAAAGALQSGAAMKALQDYGQQTALNNYFLPYMGLLGNQQAVGAGAASSVAGVGANFGNTAANINAGMGNAIQGGANSASANAIARGNANANMWGGIGSALGGLGSSFAGGFGGGGFTPSMVDLPGSTPYATLPGGLY